MSHDRARLETALRHLQTELHSLEGIDPQVRERLEHTIAEIQMQLDEPAAEAEVPTSQSAPVAADATLTERLSETARHFEETHPNLAGMVGSVIDALARMGI